MFFSFSQRCSYRVLWWTGQQISTSSLLPGPTHQHDRGERRPRDSRYSWSTTQFWAWMPASLTSFHRQRPQTYGPQYGHSVSHEEAATYSGGSGAQQPALVLFRQATCRQNETGGAENTEGLRGASHCEPALSKPSPSGKLILLVCWFFFPSLSHGITFPALIFEVFSC